ncbi:hypothetical protein CRG98_049827, partial [Punica granatum]
KYPPIFSSRLPDDTSKQTLDVDVGFVGVGILDRQSYTTSVTRQPQHSDNPSCAAPVGPDATQLQPSPTLAESTLPVTSSE